MWKNVQTGLTRSDGKGRRRKDSLPRARRGFYNLPRKVFCPADAPILVEASMMARIAKASKEPLDHSGHIDSHPSLCTSNPRAPSARMSPYLPADLPLGPP